jgi:hypothetical protein
MPISTPEITADSLYTALTAGSNFSLPVVDLTVDQYQTPSELENALYLEVTKLTTEDLSTGDTDGTGMFDALMRSLKAHLQQEYENNRITGEEYSKVYIQLTQSAMGSAVQYLLARDQSYWQATLSQQQARNAEIAVVASRVEVEATKARLKITHLDAQTSAANFASSKLRLASENAQVLQVRAQTVQVEYQTASTMPAQLAQLVKETARLDYELTSIMPKELEKSTKQIETLEAQISSSTASTAQTLYETASLLPAQLLGIEADTDNKEYQLTALMPAQTAGYTLDNLGKSYSNTYLLPEQLNSIKEQVEGHRAKTMDTRMDGLTVIAGAVGKQKELHAQQVASYQHDAEAKVAKMFVDTWITSKSLDEGTIIPSSLDNTQADEVINKIRLNLDLT